jgi:hypothetical protein
VIGPGISTLDEVDFCPVARLRFKLQEGVADKRVVVNRIQMHCPESTTHTSTWAPINSYVKNPDVEAGFGMWEARPIVLLQPKHTNLADLFLDLGGKDAFVLTLHLLQGTKLSSRCSTAYPLSELSYDPSPLSPYRHAVVSI